MKQSENRAPSGVRLLLSAGVWLTLTTAVLAALVNYSASPGERGQSPASWPAASVVPHSPGSDHLVLFLHPKCPCSRATLRQLERALTHARAPVEIDVVVFDPSGQSTDWTETDLVDAARAIPGARVTLDRDGVEARRFGIHTSGHVLFYGSSDRLLFSGGITPARGHEGTSGGLDALVACLAGLNSAPGGAAVFGCPLFDSKPRCRAGGPPCHNTK